MTVMLGSDVTFHDGVRLNRMRMRGQVSLSRAGHPCPIFIPGGTDLKLAEVLRSGGPLLGATAAVVPFHVPLAK